MEQIGIPERPAHGKKAPLPTPKILVANDLQLHLSPATRIGLAGRRRLLPETPRPTLARPTREHPT